MSSVMEGEKIPYVARAVGFDKALHDLVQDGFAVVDIASAKDIDLIRQAVRRVLAREDVVFRELGERTGAPQIQEVHHIASRAPEIMETDFFSRAKEFSQSFLKSAVHLKFDHVILKPAMSNRETGWHQDAAYTPRIWRFHRRVHWWLPLHDVPIEQGCMRYVPGTHHSSRMKHAAVGPTSDAIKTVLPEGSKVVDCPVKAGSACVHLPKTLHCTGPNTTRFPREAYILQFASPSLLPRPDFDVDRVAHWLRAVGTWVRPGDQWLQAG
ncbi:MAG: phytanoyl-CoA dioxygenase family protein [Bradyrhizobium sp.]|nr:phytanoyl-CoA dioxygenase family protein [Bradyrhizobium sp.]